MSPGVLALDWVEVEAARIAIRASVFNPNRENRRVVFKCGPYPVANSVTSSARFLKRRDKNIDCVSPAGTSFQL